MKHLVFAAAAAAYCYAIAHTVVIPLINGVTQQLTNVLAHIGR